jgi:hypothetical protein
MYAAIERIALTEFADVVTQVNHVGRRANAVLKLRLLIGDGTFVDVWLSPTGADYAYHWEQRAQRGLLHRHDNAPDHPHISTHPKHFHNGDETTIEASFIPDDSAAAIRYFLSFVRGCLLADDR